MKKRYPYRSKRKMYYHGRVGRPIIHIDKRGKTFVMVRKSGGGTRRLYNYKKYIRR